MSTLQLLHFVVRKLTFAYTLTTYTATCYTNNPCHLWLRWTSTTPQKHVNPVVVRGAPVGTFIDQCFVVYTDIEQNEAGDTFTHTFNLNAWPQCVPIWLYFWGTVGGVLSPSRSAIFQAHRPWIKAFYPAPGTGNITCDSYVNRVAAADTWQQIVSGPGSNSFPSAATITVTALASTTPNRWTTLGRGILTFDLRTILQGYTILAASLFWHGQAKSNILGSSPAIAVYHAYPADPANIVAADYTNVSFIPLTNKIAYADFKTDEYNEFIFTQTALTTIKKERVNGFALREANYDAPAIAPPWLYGGYHGFLGWTADVASPAQHPYLLIAYTT
jgi:hypothetical protein